MESSSLCGVPIPGASLEAICATLSQIAPLRLAEDWDNVGLLIGNRKSDITRVMTCLTITPDVVDEAVESRVGLIVAHHPLPFKPLAKITSDSISGSLVHRLISERVAVYSAHTAFDSASSGINAQWATLFSLEDVRPLVDSDRVVGTTREGAGKVGLLAEPVAFGELVKQASEFSGARAPRVVGDLDRLVRRVGFACGSGGSFLSAAIRKGCDALITGEATFHTCLEARSQGIGLGLLGHYASERFAMEVLAKRLAEEIDTIEVWASRSESDPLHAI